jgi:hypothetical protein
VSLNNQRFNQTILQYEIRGFHGVNFEFVQCRVILSSLKCWLLLCVVSFSFSLPINIYSYVKITVTRLKEVNVSLYVTNCALRHEDVWGSGCIDPRFLDLGTSWRWVVIFTTRSHYPRGKSPRYTLDRRLSGPQSRSEWPGEEKIFASTETRTSIPFVIHPIASRYTDCAILALVNVKFVSGWAFRYFPYCQ